MPALCIQTRLHHDLHDGSGEQAPCRVAFSVHRRQGAASARPFLARRSRRQRFAKGFKRSISIAPDAVDFTTAEGLDDGIHAIHDDPVVECCRLLHLEGAEGLQDFIASLVLSECVYKKLELDHEGVVAKVAEYLSCFPPGWVQLEAVQMSLTGIPQHYLVATSPTSLYVAFMGTKQFQDLLADANLLHTPVWAESARLAADQQSIPAAHRGFLERARAIHVEQLYELAVSRGLSLVLCGHSLGGAVAKLCTLRLLRELPDWPRPRVRCIAFATPAVGNAALAELVENAGWASHFASYYLPEDQLVQLISFSQARNSMSMPAAAAASSSSAATTGAGGAGTVVSRRPGATGGRDRGSERAGARETDSAAPLRLGIPRASSSSSVASTASVLSSGAASSVNGSTSSSGSTSSRSCGPSGLSSPCDHHLRGEHNTLFLSAGASNDSGTESRVSHGPLSSPVGLPDSTAVAAEAVAADRFDAVGASSSPSIPSRSSSLPAGAGLSMESLDEEHAGAAVMAVMEEILAPGPDQLEAAAAPSVVALGGGGSCGAAAVGDQPRNSLAAAQREALYGKTGGSWGLRLALERRRVVRRMRRLAARARIPLPKALLPVSRFHTFGEQWFVTDEGALSPEELECRQPREREREREREQQPQPSAASLSKEAAESSRGFFSFHRMLAYRQRNLDIIHRVLHARERPSQRQSLSHAIYGAVSTQHGGVRRPNMPPTTDDDEACGSGSAPWAVVQTRDDIVPRVDVHRVVLRGLLPADEVEGRVAAASADTAWTAPVSAPSQQSARPSAASAVGAATAPAMPTAHQGSPVANLFSWMAGGHRGHRGASHAGAGSSGSVGGGSGFGGHGGGHEPVHLVLELEGHHLQYCRKVSVSLVRHSVATSDWAPSAPAGATATSGGGAMTVETDVPCDVLQVLYAQPYSGTANPPPLHPVSLLRNTLHHFADHLIRRYRQPQHHGPDEEATAPPPPPAPGTPMDTSTSTSGGMEHIDTAPPLRRFRFGMWPHAKASTLGSASTGEQKSTARGCTDGTEVPECAVLPSRLLLRVTLPRAVAAGLLDGTLPAHLAVSARSDFNAVSAVPAVIQRPRVAILGTSPYAASLVQAVLAAPAALAAADMEERAAAAAASATGAVGTTAWLPPPVAWALSAMRGTAATAAAAALAAANARRGAFLPRKPRGAAAGTSAPMFAASWRGAAARKAAAAAAALAAVEVAGTAPMSAPTVAAAASSEAGPERSAEDKVYSTAPVSSASAMASGAAGSRVTAAAGGAVSTSSTVGSAAKPSGLQGASSKPPLIWRLCRVRWSVRQSLAAAAFGAAAASIANATGGVAAVGAAVGLAAALVTSLATSGGAEGGTTTVIHAGVTIAAMVAAAVAATASALAGGEALALAATAAAAAVAAAVVMTAAPSNPAAPVTVAATSHAGLTTPTGAGVTAAAAVAGPALAKARALVPGLPSPLKAPRLSHAAAPASSTSTAAPAHAQPAQRPASVAAAAAQGPRWVLRFSRGAASAVQSPASGPGGARASSGGASSGGASQGRGGTLVGGRSVGRGWSLWWRKPDTPNGATTAANAAAGGGGNGRIAPALLQRLRRTNTSQHQHQGKQPTAAAPLRGGWFPWQHARASTSPAVAAAAAPPAAATAARGWFPTSTRARRQAPAASAASNTSATGGGGGGAVVRPTPPGLPLSYLPSHLLAGFLQAAGRAVLPLPPVVVSDGLDLCNVMVDTQPSPAWPLRALGTSSVAAGAAVGGGLLAPPRRIGAKAGGGGGGVLRNSADVGSTLGQAVPAAQLGRGCHWLCRPAAPASPAVDGSAAHMGSPDATGVTAAASGAAAAAASTAAATGAAMPVAVAGLPPFVAVRRMSDGLRCQVLQRGWWWRWLLGSVVGAVLRPAAFVGMLRCLKWWGLQSVLDANRRRRLQRAAAALSASSRQSSPTSTTQQQPAAAHQHSPAAASGTSGTSAPHTLPRHTMTEWGALVVVASCRDSLRVLRSRDMNALRNQAVSAGCPLVPVLLTCPQSPPGRRVAAAAALAAACGVETSAVQTVLLDLELLHQPAAAIPRADLATVWRGTAGCGGAAELRRAVRQAVAAATRPTEPVAVPHGQE